MVSVLIMLFFSIGDGQKASAYLMDNLRDPETAYSSEPNKAPFHRALGIDVPLWVWYKRPEQSYHRRRFGVAMHGLAKLQPPDILTNGAYQTGS